jgi:uncharacterized protein (DUF1778 family)
MAAVHESSIATPQRGKANPATEKKKKPKTYNLRVDEATDRLIDKALEILGQSRTEFLLASAKVRAQEVLLNRTHFTLSAQVWDAFEADLEAEAAPAPELVDLMTRRAPWEK